jgi:hypothetical protein
MKKRNWIRLSIVAIGQIIIFTGCAQYETYLRPVQSFTVASRLTSSNSITLSPVNESAPTTPAAAGTKTNSPPAKPRSKAGAAAKHPARTPPSNVAAATNKVPGTMLVGQAPSDAILQGQLLLPDISTITVQFVDVDTWDPVKVKVYGGTDLTKTVQSSENCYLKEVIPKSVVDTFDQCEILGFAPESLKRTRNVIQNGLIRISDYNSNLFLRRSFSTKTGLNAMRNIFAGVFTGGAVATGPFSGLGASGFGLGNLLFTKTVDEFNADFYESQAFQAMQTAIISQRQQMLDDMRSKQSDPYSAYDIHQALDDVEQYDEASSITSALNRLVHVAQLPLPAATNNVPTPKPKTL